MSTKKLEKTERESKDGSTGKKRRLEIDFDKVLSPNGTAGVEDPPPDILVVQSSSGPHCDDRSEKEDKLRQREKRDQEQEEEHPMCLNLPLEIVQLEDQELQHKIHKLSGRLKNGLCSKLPDKGEKYNTLLKMHQQERRRRERSRRPEDATGCSKLASSGSSRHNGVPNQDPALQSVFAIHLMQKLEGNNNSRIQDTFGPELDTLGRGGRNKKRQNKQVAPKREEKCPLPLKGKSKIDSSSEEVFSDGKNLADANSLSQSSPSTLRRSLRQKGLTAKKTVLLLDDEEEETKSDAYKEDAALRDMSIFYPTGEDPESVEIRYGDLQCLAPGVYLTSTIMNFYIRYLQVSSSPDNDYHFFNTYFYKKLQEAISPRNSDCEAPFIKLRRWWKGIDIFQKAYIFLPVHEDLHWSLVIICIPDKEAEESGPIILHLDSLGYHRSKLVFQNVKRLLKEEWKYLKGQADSVVPMTDKIWEELPRRIDEKAITVPQQNNDSDCGPFVLFFMERFISEAPRRLSKQDLPKFGKQWFKPEEASSLRAKIKKLLMDEFDKSKTKSEPADQLSDGSESEIL